MPKNFDCIVCGSCVADVLVRPVRLDLPFGDGNLVEVDPIEVSTGVRQLFVDDHGIARISNLTRTMHRPEKRGAVIEPDQPWESILQVRCAPVWDQEEERYKIWMISAGPGFSRTRMGYAESQDGLRWTKPALNQVEVNGSKENMISML